MNRPIGGNRGEAAAEIRDKGETPASVKRGCTDRFCAVIFILCIAVFFFVVLYADWNGSYERFWNVRDEHGRLCGKDKAVVNRSYLLLCLGHHANRSQGGDLLSFGGKSGFGSSGFNYGHRECVAECPKPGAISTVCGYPYPSESYFNMICVPMENFLTRQFWNQTQMYPSLQLILVFSDIPRGSWEPICYSAVAVAILAALLLMSIDRVPGCILYMGMCSLICVPLAVGLYLCHIWPFNSSDRKNFSGHDDLDWKFGVCALLASIIFFCVFVTTVRATKQMDVANNCLKAACECIRDMPFLLVEPVFAFVLQVITFVPLLLGLILLLSCGKGDQKFHYQPEHWYLVSYYMFMMLWIILFRGSFSRFALTYGVQAWFFSDYIVRAENAPQRRTCLSFLQMCKGCLVATGYHFGTLAYGSLILALLQPFQICAKALVVARYSTTGPVSACISCCCMWFIGCVVRCTERANQDAYMSTVVNADAFSQASRQVTNVMSDAAKQGMQLRGAAWPFELALAGGLTAAGVAATFLQLQMCEKFSDRHSPHFVANPIPTLVVAGLVCVIVVMPFMITGQTSDTIFFCFVLNKKRVRKTEEQGYEGYLSSLFFSTDAPEPEMKSLLTTQ